MESQNVISSGWDALVIAMVKGCSGVAEFEKVILVQLFKVWQVGVDLE